MKKFMYMYTRIAYMITTLALVKDQTRSAASDASLVGFQHVGEKYTRRNDEMVYLLT